MFVSCVLRVYGRTCGGRYGFWYALQKAKASKKIHTQNYKNIVTSVKEFGLILPVPIFLLLCKRLDRLRSFLALKIIFTFKITKTQRHPFIKTVHSNEIFC